MLFLPLHAILISTFVSMVCECHEVTKDYKIKYVCKIKYTHIQNFYEYDEKILLKMVACNIMS